MSDEDCCAVCLAPITSKGCETSCAHRFHTTCLLRSFSTNSACPLCREDLIPVGVKDEIRLSRLENTRRTNAGHDSYRLLLQQTEAGNETLEALHKKWIEQESEYTAVDCEFADHFSSMVGKIKRTRTYRALERDRALKRSRAAASKSMFTREMERGIGEPPEGFLDCFLRDREVLGLRL